MGEGCIYRGHGKIMSTFSNVPLKVETLKQIPSMGLGLRSRTCLWLHI